MKLRKNEQNHKLIHYLAHGFSGFLRGSQWHHLCEHSTSYSMRNRNDPPDTDYSGYNFWLTKLNQFNGDFIAAEMVKAFISSTKYRQRFGPP